MPSPILEFRRILATTIAEAQLSQRVDVVEDILPAIEVKDLSGIRVTVVASADDTTLLDRSGSAQHDYAYDLGVQAKLPAGNITTRERLATCDPLITLCAEISELLLKLELDDALVVSASIKTLYVPEHLAQLNVFTSVLTVVVRSLS